MKKKILVVIFLFTVLQSFSQVVKQENIYFLKFKIYQASTKFGVPFAEICFSDKNDDEINYCIDTDFDGYAFFYVNPNNYNIDSAYIRIRFLKEQSTNSYSKSVTIALNKIELLKEMKIDDSVIIALIEYKLLNEREYKKYQKIGLMPAR